MTTQLTVVERAHVALGSGALEIHLQDLAAKHRDITAIANKAGRDQVHSAAMAIRTQRTDIRKVGKAAREDANAFANAVIEEENRLVGIIEPEEKRLISLRDAWDEARAAEKRAEEEKEHQRREHIQEMLDQIRNTALLTPGDSSDSVRQTIAAVESLAITEEAYQEFLPAAVRAKQEALSALETALANTIRHEEEQARIKAEQEAQAARLAEERAELERLRAEAEMLLRAQEECAAKARAEEEARMAAERAEIARQREEQEAKAKTERAELERQAAELRAQQEVIRKQQEAAEAEAKRQEDERLTAEFWAAAERERAEREEAERAEAKHQADEAERQRIARENSPPSATDVIALVASTYGVSQSAALGWLNGMFGNKPRPNGD